MPAPLAAPPPPPRAPRRVREARQRARRCAPARTCARPSRTRGTGRAASWSHLLLERHCHGLHHAEGPHAAARRPLLVLGRARPRGAHAQHRDRTAASEPSAALAQRVGGARTHGLEQRACGAVVHEEALPALGLGSGSGPGLGAAALLAQHSLAQYELDRLALLATQHEVARAASHHRLVPPAALGEELLRALPVSGLGLVLRALPAYGGLQLTQLRRRQQLQLSDRPRHRHRRAARLALGLLLERRRATAPPVALGPPLQLASLHCRPSARRLLRHLLRRPPRRLLLPRPPRCHCRRPRLLPEGGGGGAFDGG
eukprot:scaffold63378_cov63-Phaeocystis_antarctica.AAC.2